MNESKGAVVSQISLVCIFICVVIIIISCGSGENYSSSRDSYSKCSICGGTMKCNVCGDSGLYCENSATGYGTKHYCNDHAYKIYD